MKNSVSQTTTRKRITKKTFIRITHTHATVLVRQTSHTYRFQMHRRPTHERRGASQGGSTLPAPPSGSPPHPQRSLAGHCCSLPVRACCCCCCWHHRGGRRAQSQRRKRAAERRHSRPAAHRLCSSHRQCHGQEYSDMPSRDE